MPYRELEKIVPMLALSGVPARMMVMATLAAGVLTSIAFALLLRGSSRARLAAGVLGLMLTLEYIPRPVPSVAPAVPEYVTILQRIPNDAGLLDLASGYSSERPFGSDTGAGIALYYQMLHQHPMASGYIARVPTSAWQRLMTIETEVDAGVFGGLCRDFHLRYLVIAPESLGLAGLASAQLLVSTPDADLYDLAPNGQCVT